ncbi:MAG: hypothetical protein JST33_13375 [Actinobacteria bacterium]|nr:hypothetical protein [Actinomycetota bacterium]
MDADVTTEEQADALAARILSPRELPLVLVSTTGAGELLFDVAMLRSALDGLAEVVVLETGPISKRVESLLPEKTQVFNGAARSYPPDFADSPVWTRSHLRFPQFADTRTLIDDALAQAGRHSLESAPPPEIRTATAIVEGITAGGTRAIARLDDGTVVTVTSERLPQGIPLERAVLPGRPVTGVLDGFELQPEPAPVTHDLFGHDEIRLALVVKVTDLRATLQLHPRVEPLILRRRDVTTDHEQPVSEVLRVGQIVPVRLRRADSRSLAASVWDVPADAEVLESPPLVTGGPPWLSAATREEPAPPVPAPHSVPARNLTEPGSASDASPGTGAAPYHAGEIAALAHEIVALRGDILALTNLVAGLRRTSSDSEVARLKAENASLQMQVSRERAAHATTTTRLSRAVADRKEAGRELREARRPGSRAARPDADEKSLRAAIAELWTERTDPGERDLWPLREYIVGPEFLRSLAALDQGQLAKAIRASVDAITGRAREIAGRDLHRLRTGDGGDDPYQTRPDGAKAWRASIEQKAPGGRRLHYWELAGNAIELSRVVHHDDTRA